MLEEFEKYLENKEHLKYYYLENNDYVLLFMTADQKIHMNASSEEYAYLVSFPRKKYNYSNIKDVLTQELEDTKAIGGAIYQLVDGKFKLIISKNIHSKLK